MKPNHLILPLVASLLFGCGQAQQPIQPEPVRPIKAMQVGLQEKFSIRKYPGIAQAADAVTLAFEVSGKLNQIPVEVGDIVKKGDVLASLEATDFTNALEQAKAELKRSLAQYQRTQEAADFNAVSRQELTNAQAAYESAKATVGLRQKALENAVLRAPFDAIVTATYVQSFGNVFAKQEVVRLVDPSTIEMLVDVPEDVISYAEENMQIQVSFDAFPNQVLMARITEIGTEASTSTRTYPVILSMPQPKTSMILPGMAGKAWRQDPIVNQQNQPVTGFEVPISAIFSDAEGQAYVWVYQRDNQQVQRQQVTTSQMTDKGVLVNGLQGGEIIATAGVNVLKAGQKVRLLKAKGQ